jgi:hypothetical protein
MEARFEKNPIEQLKQGKIQKVKWTRNNAK